MELVSDSFRKNHSLIHVYTAGLATLAGFMALGFAVGGHPVGNLWVVACLGAVAALAERGGVWLSSTTEVSIALVPILFAGVLFGPLAAMIVAAASMLSDIRGPTDQPYLKWATYTASRSITGGFAGLAAGFCASLASNHIAGVAAATAAGALTAEGLDVAFAATVRRLRGKGRMLDVVRMLGPLALAVVPLYAPIVALLVIAYQEVSAWTLPLFLVPAVAAQRLYAMYHSQRRLTEDVLLANERLERANLSFATALVATLDARDEYTAGHSAAVAIYARDIAARMDLAEAEQRLGHLCGLVHDIGKVGLPPGLLEKPGPLSLDERRQMERHSEIGEGILAKVDDYGEIARVVRHHHERVDGNGYPDRLADEEIPLLSRIIAVADAYNAMTSDRPYRDAMPSRVARLRLAQAADSQFDTSVVAAFEAILAGAPESYRSGRRADFTFEEERLLSTEVSALAV